MKLLLLSLFLLSHIFSQINVTVLSIGDRFQVDSIEYEILINTISLYNVNEEEQISFKIDTLGSFDEVLQKLKTSNSAEKNSLLGLASITRTEARKEFFDFSSIYIPAKEVITTLKKNSTLSFSDLKNQRVGYQSKSIEEISINRLMKNITLIPVGFLHYSEKSKALLNGDIKFSIDDNISIWDSEGITIIHDLKIQNGDGIAIAYPKGSKLANKLDRYLKYYINSSRFYRLIQAKYGIEIARYFKQELRLLNKDF